MRQQRGPVEPQGEPQVVQVQVRRYQCQKCRAIVQVVPKGVVAHKHYAGGAIALALVLWSIVGLNMEQVRQRVNPWKIKGQGAGSVWKTLRRWAREFQEGKLFSKVANAARQGGTLRQAAQRGGEALCAHALGALEGGSISQCAFEGGMCMA